MLNFHYLITKFSYHSPSSFNAVFSGNSSCVTLISVCFSSSRALYLWYEWVNHVYHYNQFAFHDYILKYTCHNQMMNLPYLYKNLIYYSSAPQYFQNSKTHTVHNFPYLDFKVLFLIANRLIFFSIVSKLNNIQRIKTSSPSCCQIMFSIIFYPVFTDIKM